MFDSQFENILVFLKKSLGLKTNVLLSVNKLLNQLKGILLAISTKIVFVKFHWRISTVTLRDRTLVNQSISIDRDKLTDRISRLKLH